MLHYLSQKTPISKYMNGRLSFCESFLKGIKIITFVLKKYGLFKKARIPFIPASEHSLWKRKYGLF